MARNCQQNDKVALTSPCCFRGAVGVGVVALLAAACSSGHPPAASGHPSSPMPKMSTSMPMPSPSMPLDGGMLLIGAKDMDVAIVSPPRGLRRLGGAVAALPHRQRQRLPQPRHLRPARAPRLRLLRHAGVSVRPRLLAGVDRSAAASLLRDADAHLTARRRYRRQGWVAACDGARPYAGGTRRP